MRPRSAFLMTAAMMIFSGFTPEANCSDLFRQKAGDAVDGRSGEQDRLVAELDSRIRQEGKLVMDSDNLQRTRRLDFLAVQLEASANDAEIEVWRELARN